MILELEDLAGFLLFSSIKNKQQLDEKINGQWMYRKNKDIRDVNKAIEKGLKLGSGKTERELECVALYLKDVFKKDKKGEKNNGIH